MASAKQDKSAPYFPLADPAHDGFNKGDEATVTCFCGGVQIAFPTSKPGLITSFICHCSDCRKITASMFATNFTVKDKYMRYIRGKELLKVYGPQATTIKSGNTMANHFCSDCGTLLFRVSSGYPGLSIMRVGTIDDQLLPEGKLKPLVEQFVENRVDWLSGATGVMQHEGSGLDHPKARL